MPTRLGRNPTHIEEDATLKAQLRTRLAHCLEFSLQFSDGITNANMEERVAKIRQELHKLDRGSSINQG
jgi:hypothetical protein